MSDKMRLRFGDTNPVIAAVDSSTKIEIGDMVYQDFNNAKSASVFDGSKLSNPIQEQFADNFLGVAMQRSRSGDINSIRVATTGVFEFDCSSGTFELGDLMGVDENAAGDGLLDQQVAKVAASQYAIGRVAKRVSVAATCVLVDIRSKVMGPLT